jgi:hypothetical protein
LHTHPEDASPSNTHQRPDDAVSQTPSVRSADAAPSRHARLAASRSLRAKDGNRARFSGIQALALPTPFAGNPALGNAVARGKASVAKRSSALRIGALRVTPGRQRFAAAHRFDVAGARSPPAVGALRHWVHRVGQTLSATLVIPSKTWVFSFSAAMVAMHTPLGVPSDARRTTLLTIAVASDRSAASWRSPRPWPSTTTAPGASTPR